MPSKTEFLRPIEKTSETVQNVFRNYSLYIGPK